MRLYPWQTELWQRLRVEAGRLHHAWLLRGPRGIGKLRLASTFAQARLCQTPLDDGLPCEQCSSCSWFAQGHHPDFRLVQPQDDESTDATETARKKPAQVIKIDQIRELNQSMSLSTHQAGHRVVLIEPAETLNVYAANALLKTLEEPAPGSLFVLVAHRMHGIPATILSRCRAFDIAAPTQSQALDWLQQQGVAEAANALALAGGAPLAALEQAEASLQQLRRALINYLGAPQDGDVVDASAQLKNTKPADAIRVLQCWTYDLLLLRFGAAAHYHREHATTLATLAQKVRPVKLARHWQRLVEARQLEAHPLNARLFIEDLLLDYQTAFR